MISGLILVTLMGLIALVLLLGYRMVTLTHSEPLLLHPVDADDTVLTALKPDQKASTITHRPSISGRSVALSDRTELLTGLHILAGLQERDCRVRGLELLGAPEAVQSYATAWLYGAACALCEPSLRHSDMLDGLVAHIASRKIGYRQPQALQTIGTLTSSSIFLACFRNGMEGAEFWKEHQHVPPRYSLYETITNNAFI